MVEAGGAGRRRMAALALPGVEADVVVVVAGGDEGGVLAVARLQLEAEHAAIEGERPLDVGDLEMGVADADAGIDRPGEERGASSSRRGCLRLTCGALLPGSRSPFLITSVGRAVAASRAAATVPRYATSFQALWKPRPSGIWRVMPRRASPSSWRGAFELAGVDAAKPAIADQARGRSPWPRRRSRRRRRRGHGRRPRPRPASRRRWC